MHAVRRVDLNSPVVVEYHSKPGKLEWAVYLLDQAAAKASFTYSIVSGTGGRHYGYRIRLLVSAHKKDAAQHALSKF